MLKRIILSISLLFQMVGVNAQDKPALATETKPAPVSWKIDGQIGIATNGNAFFLNFGGPNVRFQYKKVAFGLGAYPSLRVWEDKPRTLLSPSLGFGGYLQYKKVGLLIPFYYNPAKNEWIPTTGLSYKLSK